MFYIFRQTNMHSMFMCIHSNKITCFVSVYLFVQTNEHVYEIIAYLNKQINVISVLIASEISHVYGSRIKFHFSCNDVKI